MSEILPPEPPASPPPAPMQEPPSGPDAEQRQWAMLAHLSILAGGIISYGVGGWAAFAGPLIVWLIRRDQPGFALQQTKEALNFSLLLSLCGVVMAAFVWMTFGLGVFLMAPLMLIIGVAALIFIVIGAIKANDGLAYRYPLNWRVVT